MLWTKYNADDDEEEHPYIPLPAGRECDLECQTTYECLLLAMGPCHCSLVNAFEDGVIHVDEVEGIKAPINKWETTDLSSLSDEDGAQWAPRVFQRFYPSFVKEAQSQAKVRKFKKN